MPENAVSVVRPGKYGNPYVVGSAIRRDSDGAVFICMNVEQCVSTFRLMVEQKLAAEPDFLEPLRGKDLACWCAEDAAHCHADVLLDLANRSQDDGR